MSLGKTLTYYAKKIRPTSTDINEVIGNSKMKWKLRM